MTIQPTEKPLRYRPEIDGLRALAVLAVILFHLKPAWLSGGFLGVDVFFVISGFLITSIILREQEADTFSFKAFWLRRARRILPVLVSVVIVSTLAAHFLLIRSLAKETGFQGISALFSLANFTFSRLRGEYWGLGAENSPYLHTWSLSVEEQFYFFFPILLFLVLKFKPRLLIPLLASLLAGSLALFLYGAGHFPNTTFFMLPTRAWELAAGALLAAVQGRDTLFSKGAGNGWPGLAGILLIILSYFSAPVLSANFILPVLGATLVLAFARQGPAHRILTWAPMVFIGQISYSLYMWHWPMIVFCRDQIPHSSISALVLTILFSIASTYWIERPARSHPRTLPFLAGGLTIALAGSFWLTRQPEFYDAGRFSQTTWNGWRYDLTPHRDDEEKQIARKFHGVIRPEREPGLEKAYLEEGIIKHYSAGDPQIVVLGDSHGVMWGNAIDGICRDLGVTVSFYTMDGISPFIDMPIVEKPQEKVLSAREKYLYDLARVRFITKWKPEIAIVVAKWSIFSLEAGRPMFSFLETQTQHILVVEQPPELPFDRINLGQYLCYKDFQPKAGLKQYLAPPKSPRYENGRALIREIAREFPKVQLVTISPIYKGPEGNLLVLDGKDLVYVDDNHLSEFGISLSSPGLKEAVEKILRP